MTTNHPDLSGFMISTDKNKLDLKFIHTYLSKQSYWAEGIPFATVERAVAGSMCFGIYHASKQIGFARMITDSATFAYLADVFVDLEYRGRGLSKWLMEVITGHPDLQGLRRYLLATRDAHSLYRQFGFESLTFPERWMQRHFPDVYKSHLTHNT